MSILDPFRSPRASKARAAAAVIGLLLAAALVVTGLVKAQFALACFAGGVVIAMAVVGGTLLYLARQSRLRTLLPQANEAMRQADMSRLVGDAIAVIIDGFADAATDGQDGAALRRHAAKASAHWQGLSDRWLQPVARGPGDRGSPAIARA
jgi:hypothetical protein